MPQTSKPSLECDIVMKGGITSGVVYPLAVVELSNTYRFRNVGGTSAGAIAAAATAAAELGRQRLGHDQPGVGFKLLERLPTQLQQPARGQQGTRGQYGTHVQQGSMLSALFQPQPRTARLFQVLMAFLEPDHQSASQSPGQNLQARIRKILRVALTALRTFWTSALVGAIPGVAVMFLIRPTNILETVLGGLIGLLALVVGVLTATLISLYQTITNDIPANNFGLCNGYRPDPQRPTENPPLTEWLHRYLNELAGRPPDGAPLTFADLQGAGINLLMITTNLTHGVPQHLPFDQDTFYFDPAEFKQLFPEAVVASLRASGEQDALERLNKKRKRKQLPELPLTPENLQKTQQRGTNNQVLQPMPSRDHLPVVVAVRMSLSFPVLLSAVPLYAFHKSKNDARRIPKRCWFSDGGITSNFPVHFFDSPLPHRPTFAINLIPFGEGETPSTDQSRNVWMPNTNQGGIQPLWLRFDQNPGGLGKLFGFLGAIFTTAQTWVDNSQLKMPGYRDRIAHVKLQASEGGLNLNMPEPVIKDLTERGRAAGRQLVWRFARQHPRVKLNWKNHRWVRYRATMASLETYLFRLHEGYMHTSPGEESFEQLIARGERYKRHFPLFDPPIQANEARVKSAPSYPLDVYEPRNVDQVGFALETTRDLMEVIAQWKNRHQDSAAASFNSENVPHPLAVLRAQPGGRTSFKQARADGVGGLDGKTSDDETTLSST